MISKNQIKFIKSLQKKKFRLKSKCFVVESTKNVNEFLNSDYTVQQIFATASWIEKYNIIDGVSVKLVKESEMQRISTLKTPSDVLAVVNIPIEQDQIDFSGINIVLDDIKDPGNLGTIIRICDWFGIANIYCSQETVDLYNSKVIQSTMGSICRVNVIYTDIQDVPWVDVVSDAHHLPFVKKIFTNILMIDVLHHLHSPVLFFEEASKVLEVGGRIVLVEPAITKTSRFFHSEPVNMQVNAFDKKLTTTDPYDSNQALPTLLFKDLVKFEELISDFKVIYKNEFGFLTYPLSGGYRSWSFLPISLYPMFYKVEKYLETFLSSFMGFRMLVVLEKIK